jgi:hypothetical protein
MRILKKNTPFI